MTANKNESETFERFNSNNIPLKNDTTFSDGFCPENPHSSKNNNMKDFKIMFSSKNIRPLSFKKIKIRDLKNLEPQEKLVLNYINRIIKSKSKNKRNESADYIPSRKNYKNNTQKTGNHRQSQAFFGIKKLIINESIKNACKDLGDTSKFRDLSKETHEETNCTYINENGIYIFSKSQGKKKKKYTDYESNFKLIQNFICSNIKYKKLYENLKKENENLNEKIQKLQDELEIMRDEDKLNKEKIQENDEKIKEISALIKQQISNYDQKIFNYKELLFKKDTEIQKLTKEITEKDLNSKNSLDELKKIIENYEKIILNQKEFINIEDNKIFNENNLFIKNDQNYDIINKDMTINNKENEVINERDNNISQ